AQRALPRRLAELAEFGPVELVRLAELVDEPDDLVPVPDGVGGELRPDHEVDGAAVDLVEVDQAPEERLRQDPLARGPLERDGDEGGRVGAGTGLVGQLRGEDLGPAVRERDLRRTDENSQVLARIA